MKYLFIILLSLSFSLGISAVGFAETGDVSPAPTSTADLSLKNIKVLDDHHVRVVFTEPIDVESVTLKLTKQSDNSSIRINVLT